MNARARGRMFGLAAPGMLALMVWGMYGLPPAGEYRGVYGHVLSAVAVAERHSTDVVTSVNFDYRAFDTLGEEFILFASVLGVTLLLRKTKGEHDEEKDGGKPEGRGREGSSYAVRGLGQSLVGVTVLFGLYVVAHGNMTPGGGFQGGVVLATAPLLVYLAGDAEIFRRIAPEALVEAAEAAGAAGFVLLGLLGLLRGGAYLQNVLPLGKAGTLLAAGTIPLINLATGLEVGAGFVLLLTTFVQEAEHRKGGGK